MTFSIGLSWHKIFGNARSWIMHSGTPIMIETFLHVFWASRNNCTIGRLFNARIPIFALWQKKKKMLIGSALFRIHDIELHYMSVMCRRTRTKVSVRLVLMSFHALLPCPAGPAKSRRHPHFPEAFRTNIVLHDDEAKSFIDTMVVNTPEEMKITSEELAEMQQIAKKLGFSPL